MSKRKPQICPVLQTKKPLCCRPPLLSPSPFQNHTGTVIITQQMHFFLKHDLAFVYPDSHLSRGSSTALGSSACRQLKGETLRLVTEARENEQKERIT